ncbi:hypothetical protein Scep_023855 [Stephania cephalantha]|uniref:Uncharacterized protein n=1 Tax=Stephania cephalantha TaxID=152367 RepID=A0AAP0HXV9_9MAGN
MQNFYAIRRRIFFVVKDDRYGRKLHPSDRVAREMTRAYKYSLHKDGYSWEHIRDVHWNQWKQAFFLLGSIG